MTVLPLRPPIPGRDRPTHKVVAWTCLYCLTPHRTNVRVGHYTHCRQCHQKNPGPKMYQAMVAALAGHAAKASSHKARAERGAPAAARPAAVPADDLDELRL